MQSRKVLLLIGALLSISGLSAAPFGFSISDSNRILYRIDLGTGVATSLGAVDYPVNDELEGFAAIGSTLYGVGEANNNPGALRNITVPPGSLIGSDTRSGDEAGAAAFGGLIYNTQANSILGGPTILYSINPATGAATSIGSSTIDAHVDGLAINSAGEAFGSDFQSTGSLYRVNLGTGGLTLVGALGGATGYDSGLAFDDATGTLYALREDGVIYTLNTSTGAASFQAVVTIGGTRVPGDLEGLEIVDTAAIPEPGSLALLGSGLLGLTVYARKRRQSRA